MAPLSRRNTSRGALASALVVLAFCGQTGPHRNRPAVRVTVPSQRPRDAAIETLEPAPTPSPSPSPGQPTPPRPTPTPLEPPRSATIRAAAGAQKGAQSSHCWVYGDGRSACRTYPVPSQSSPLRVRKGESVILSIDAAISPNEEKIRPFQTSRDGYPQSTIDPALETSLEIDLDEGVWDMDLCATWRGHGPPVCWLFRLEVSA
jgi:hypothetical protein